MLWFGCSSWIPCLKSHFLGTCLYLVTAALGRMVSPPARNAPLKVEHILTSAYLCLIHSQKFLLINDYYPQAIGAVINDWVITQSENSQVQHGGRTSKAIWISLYLLYLSSDPGKLGVLSIDLDVYISSPCCVDFIDVTLDDEDTNSLSTDEAIKTIPGNEAMQVAPPGGQICNPCKWRHLVAKFANDSCHAT